MIECKASTALAAGLVMALISVGAHYPVAAAAPAASAADLEFFEAKVRPILAANCYTCHGPSKQKSNLRWDYIDFILTGGERGPAIAPGDPAASRMIKAIGYADPDLQMPPKSKLSAEKIAVLTDWVKRGAPWPNEPRPEAGDASGGFDLAARRAAHWSWRPIRAVSPPQVKDGNWPINAIDHFILARLEAEDLRPAPPADRRTLIRRVSLDLVGLPPTPEQVEAFVADKSPDAYERIVDELLASPHFGERWARHWLDLMRYAETYGHEFDYAIKSPWLYRDYVIRALNADVPYDQWVREHVAGDLLPNPRRHPKDGYNESIIATGWWFLHEQTHAPTDVRQHEADRVDNQIDVFGKAFMGLTLACARCHDHKFDAISAKDYYAIAGYLQSSRQQEAYLDPGGKIGKVVTGLEAIRVQADRAMAALKVKSPKAPAVEHKDSQLFASFDDGDYDDAGWQATGWAWSDGPTRPGQWDRVTRRAAYVRPGLAHSGMLSEKLVGTLRSPEFDLDRKQIALRVFGKGKVRLIIDSYTMARNNGLLFKGFDVNIDTKGKWQWVRIGGDMKLYAGKGDHRGHLEIIDDDAGAYLAVDEVRFTDGALPGGDAQAAALPKVPGDDDAAFEVFADQMDEAAGGVPGPLRALAMTDGTGEDSYVHIRGGWKEKGATAPRQLPEAVAGEPQTRLAARDGSGRLQLAGRMFDPANPYPARVRVNRVWHHLFGRGIVATVDNFGVLGEKPTHPELLDYLAERFRTSLGWSQKKLIREIVLSRTYRMSSKPADTVAEEKDAANLLLHRMRVRRLEGEIIRDAILAVSGRLDRKMYGKSVAVHLTPFMEGRGRPRGGPLDGAGRRSIYIEVRRNFLSPMFLAFDTPQPFNAVGRRNVSNVPAQALILMNDPLVIDQARKWAQRITKSYPEPAGRIERMYREAFGRPPTSAEQQKAQAFIVSQGAAYGLQPDAARQNEQVWADFAHVMFNVKDFVVVN